MAMWSVFINDKLYHYESEFALQALRWALPTHSIEVGTAIEYIKVEKAALNAVADALREEIVDAVAGFTGRKQTDLRTGAKW